MNKDKVKIVVLMSTYNGERFLEEQLHSLKKQVLIDAKGKIIDLHIVVRDDGSTDATQQILTRWQEKGELTWYTGKNLGPARSFMNLLNNAPDADYYAFCDQDDVWLPEKISVAISKLDNQSDKPALYLSRYTMVDKELNPIRHGKATKYNYTFGESFITTPATGCTMLMNRSMKQLSCRYNPSFISMHDGWVYHIAQSVGAYIYADSKSYILYRQHGNNVIGGKQGFIKRWLNRFNRFHSGRCYRWKTIIESYRGYKDLMSENKRELVEDCINYKKSFKNRLRFLRHKELRTPTKLFQIIFYFVVLLKKY